jgi:hypothetical protein
MTFIFAQPVGLQHGQRDCDFLGNNERDIARRKPGLIEQQLFLAVLTPLTDKSGIGTTTKTTLWSRFGPPVDYGHCKFPNLNSAISQESGSGRYLGIEL